MVVVVLDVVVVACTVNLFVDFVDFNKTIRFLLSVPTVESLMTMSTGEMDAGATPAPAHAGPLLSVPGTASVGVQSVCVDTTTFS